MGNVLEVEEGDPGDVIAVVVKLSWLSKKLPICGSTVRENRVQLLKVRQKLWMALVRDVGLVMIMSNLSLFS